MSYTLDETGTAITTDEMPAAGAEPQPWTQADVNRIKRAIAASGNSGTVTYSDGSSIRYVPIAEARTLLEMMQADVRATTAANPDPARRPVRAFRGMIRSGY